MVNVDRLKGILKEKRLSYADLMEPLGVKAVSSVYRKMENNGESLTVGEATAIGRFLNLNQDQMTAIFFDPFVASDATT